MSFDWSEYLKVARELIGVTTPPASSEARLRAGISRAYYAAFNKSRDYIELVHHIQWIPKAGESHQFVIDWYRSHPDDTYQLIGYLLGRLRRNRRLADYERTFGKLSMEAAYSLEKTDEVLRLLATLPQ